jgi:tRNA pseudouridine55 synthase
MYSDLARLTHWQPATNNWQLPMLTLHHKPPGVTSFSLVQAAIDAALKANPTRKPKVIHAGALDPFATGLLILLHGPAVKLFDHLHPIPKAYEATVTWGAETDNGDPLGKPVATADASHLTPESLDGVLRQFVGWQEQVPPRTSNKRIGGERAYQKAHRGEAFELPPARVYLHEARWVDHDLPRSSRIHLVARGGYYVRSLARDLGRAAGCRGHLSQLRRTAIGTYADPGPGNELNVKGPDLLPWLPYRTLSEAETSTLRQSRAIELGNVSPPPLPLPEGFPSPEVVLVRGMLQGKLMYLLVAKEGRLEILTPFPGGI